MQVSDRRHPSAYVQLRRRIIFFRRITVNRLEPILDNQFNHVYLPATCAQRRQAGNRGNRKPACVNYTAAGSPSSVRRAITFRSSKILLGIDTVLLGQLIAKSSCSAKELCVTRRSCVARDSSRKGKRHRAEARSTGREIHLAQQGTTKPRRIELKPDLRAP